MGSVSSMMKGRVQITMSSLPEMRFSLTSLGP